jgi:sugar phosphate isomerase/epimerase
MLKRERGTAERSSKLRTVAVPSWARETTVERMQFGCCVNMLVPTDMGTGVEMADRVAAAGFEYFELPVARFAPLADKQFGTLCRQVSASGLKVESCNDFFPPELKLVGPEFNLGGLRSYASVAFERAARLGAKNVVFGSGGARTVPAGFSLQQAFGQLFELLRELGPVADEHDITICIEPLNRTECNIVLNLHEACELARRVNHPRVQVLADYYHFALEYEPISHLIDAGPWIRHVHFSNPQGRGYPRTADPKFAAFCRGLRENGYNRRMSVEAFSDRFEDDAAATLRLMRELVAE